MTDCEFTFSFSVSDADLPKDRTILENDDPPSTPPFVPTAYSAPKEATKAYSSAPVVIGDKMYLDPDDPPINIPPLPTPPNPVVAATVPAPAPPVIKVDEVKHEPPVNNENEHRQRDPASMGASAPSSVAPFTPQQREQSLPMVS